MIFKINIMIAHVSPANQRTGVKRANIYNFCFLLLWLSISYDINDIFWNHSPTNCR